MVRKIMVTELRLRAALIAGLLAFFSISTSSVFSNERNHLGEPYWGAPGSPKHPTVVINTNQLFFWHNWKKPTAEIYQQTFTSPLIVEKNTLAAAVKCIKNNMLRGDLIEVLAFEDHGSKFGQGVGLNQLTAWTIPFHKHALQELKPFLAPDALVVLGGCNTGYAKGLLREMSLLLGNTVTVRGYTVPTSSLVESVQHGLPHCDYIGGNLVFQNYPPEKQPKSLFPYLVSKAKAKVNDMVFGLDSVAQIPLDFFVTALEVVANKLLERQKIPAE